MKIIFKSKNKYVIRFDKGEELIGKLIDFCKKRKINSGYFIGIGAGEKAILSFYNIHKKEYIDKEIEQNFEIAGLQGNIAKMKKETIIHAHGVLSDSKMQAQAGHIKKLIVSATCEIVLEKFEDKIERQYSAEIGLNLMNK